MRLIATALATLCGLALLMLGGMWLSDAYGSRDDMELVVSQDSIRYFAEYQRGCYLMIAGGFVSICGGVACCLRRPRLASMVLVVGAVTTIALPPRFVVELLLAGLLLVSAVFAFFTRERRLCIIIAPTRCQPLYSCRLRRPTDNMPCQLW